MVTNYMFEKIRKLVREGCSDSEIARRLRINRKTVAKYRKSNAPPEYSPRKKSTKIDCYQGFEAAVASLLKEAPKLTGTEIFELLVDQGYSGSERTVQRRLAELRKNDPKERFFEQEYEPGEQSQFDFKEMVPLPFQQGEIICHLHFSTLPHSGYFRVKAFPNRCYESFIEGVHAFFENIGGLTESVRIDNLSPCVKQVLKGNKRLYTKAFSRAIDYYGFKVLPCRPGKGSDKGDVEREIRSRTNRIRNKIRLTGRIFTDFDDLNHWLADFCDNNQSGESRSKFKDEQCKLPPLPPRKDNILCFVDTTRISLYGTARVSRLKASYSAPDNTIGSMCKIVVDPYTVKIYHGVGPGEPVAVHKRLPEGESSILLSHTIRSLVRKPGAIFLRTSYNMLKSMKYQLECS